MIYSIDFETRSRTDLKKVGLDKYAKCPSTEVICIAFGNTSETIQVLPPQNPSTNQLWPLMQHVSKGGKIQAWNAMFEYCIWNHVCVPKYGWPSINLEQMIDSMAIAAANNIPQNLEEAAIFVGAMEKKDPVGKRLIQKLSKPNSKGLFNTDFVLLDQMYEYCKQDVRTEMAIVKELRPLTEQEQQIWIMTQKINERGVPVDIYETQNAISTVNSAKDAVNAEMLGITGHINANQVPLLLGWLNAQGMDMADLTYETVTVKLLDPTLPKNIRRALELRQLGSQTSVAKYEKMLEVQEGGRIRNTLVYHGASTGRWASRGGLNLQNIARPTLGDEALERAIERVLEKGEGGTMEELSSLVRSVIKAPYGQTFVDVDFSSIENRVASWIAGQTDKVELFRQGLDEYKAFASTSLYEVPYDEVTKDMRQISKSAVLGCMFGQGFKGLVKYAEGMGVKLTETQSKNAVDAYRLSYAKVKNCWYACERSAIDAINNPNMPFQNGKLLFKFVKDALWMRLPSGRLICWRDPKVEQQLTPRGFMKDGVTVRSQNTFTRQWSRNNLIGSSIFQSAVQGTARDILAECTLSLETAGFEVINLIHDEVLLVADENRGDKVLATVTQMMTVPPQWAPDFPLAAEGWVGKRYRK